jgi:hypothetical protein
MTTSRDHRAPLSAAADEGRFHVFLTGKQLADLTDARSHRKQIEWLAQRGYRFELSSRGRPKVLLSAVESRLGQIGPTTRKQEPNFEGLRGYGSHQKNAPAPAAPSAT